MKKEGFVSSSETAMFFVLFFRMRQLEAGSYLNEANI